MDKQPAKRATVYMDPELHRALKMKAARNDLTLSELVNQAVRLSLAEDHEDMLAFEERANEPDIDFQEVLKELKESGKL